MSLGAFVLLTAVPGARRRVDPETLMVMTSDHGRPLWDMPAPIRYAEHVHVDKKGRHPIKVPIYRGASASYARRVRSEVRRNQRKAAERQATVDALNETEKGESNA
jgi:hypothetical protein